MKLINKKTKEIGYLWCMISLDEAEVVDENGCPISSYETLDKLYEEWEDYKEPKEFYFIDQFMSVSKGVVDDVEYAGRNNAVNYAKKTSNNLKTAGNYFETREEAEEAVEKLKAWKRLKNKGFEITGFDHIVGNGWVKGEINFLIPKDNLDEADLDLLFGGKDV